MKKEKNASPEKKVSEKMLELFEIPKDKSGIITSLNITGIHEATVEGYKGIIDYSENIIKLNTTQFIMEISGEKLEIAGITEEYISIKGVINGVKYIF